MSTAIIFWLTLNTVMLLGVCFNACFSFNRKKLVICVAEQRIRPKLSVNIQVPCSLACITFFLLQGFVLEGGIPALAGLLALLFVCPLCLSPCSIWECTEALPGVGCGCWRSKEFSKWVHDEGREEPHRENLFWGGHGRARSLRAGGHRRRALNSQAWSRKPPILKV